MYKSLFSFLLINSILYFMYSCSVNNTSSQVCDSIPWVTYTISWELIYICNKNGWSQMYRSNKEIGGRYDSISLLKKQPLWDEEILYPVYIQYTLSWKTWLESESRKSEIFNTLLYVMSKNNIPYLIGEKDEKKYILRWWETISSWNQTLDIVEISNSTHKVLLRTESGLLFDNKFFSWANNGTIYGTGILFTRDNGQKSELVFNDKTIYSWENKLNLLASLKHNGWNALEFVYWGLTDDPGKDPEAYMQYVVNWIPHEKISMLDELHVPFFWEKLFFYAFKKWGSYFANVNGSIWGPYISYPEIYTFWWDIRSLVVWKKSEDQDEVILDNIKIWLYTDVADINLSPNKQHIAYSADDVIFIDGVELNQQSTESKFNPIINNSWSLVAYIGYFNNDYFVHFGDKILKRFSANLLDGTYQIMPILNNEHLIIFSNEKLIVDEIEIENYKNTNPYGIQECGNGAFFLENIKPPEEKSQILIWYDGKYMVFDDYLFWWTFSYDCQKLAYVKKTWNQSQVVEIPLFWKKKE